tara:strand:- start:316 stop:459 length:144 start_codon:yes stop_codon:yes gene_type:complete
MKAHPIDPKQKPVFEEMGMVMGNMRSLCGMFPQTSPQPKYPAFERYD